MTLRRPAAHLRRAPGWRRSGDESYWDRVISDGESNVSLPHAHALRPQSAIEGGQLDRWLQHLEMMECKRQCPAHNQPAPAFSDLTSTSVLGKEPAGLEWRHIGLPSFSRDPSLCGSSSLNESSLGSQESLQVQTQSFSPLERRGSWERVHITQVPRKEQAQLSNLAPVKIGWLPIQRRAMMMADASNRKQFHFPGHVKLKQPITPTFNKNPAAIKMQAMQAKEKDTIRPQQRAKKNEVGDGNKKLKDKEKCRLTEEVALLIFEHGSPALSEFDRDGEAHRSHTSLSDVKTWQTSDRRSSVIKQEPEKSSSPSNGGNKPVGWQALCKSWNSNRLSTFLRGSKSIEPATGNNSDPNRKSSLLKTRDTEPPRHSPLHRTTSATASLCGANGSTQPLNAQTDSAAATLIPQNKAGFSSITISSKKVSGMGSLQGSGSSESPSLTPDHQPMDPNSRQLMLQRKAIIVKVTDRRVIESSTPSTRRAGTPSSSYDLDTVVHRRKATIIKVTEHTERYTPPKLASRYPEHRHSYTDGAYEDNGTWSHSQHNAAPSYHHTNSTQNSLATHNSGPERHGKLHRSTLSLVVSRPPTTAVPISSEAPPNAAGQRLDRQHRPLSWYGNAIGHSEPSKKKVTQPAARKWCFGPPQETNLNPMNSDNSLISPGKAVKEAGQPVADTLKPKGGVEERLGPPEEPMQQESPSLTLISAPDAHSHQSPEEVLALNAAAIIANIKLQRQLSKKKTPNSNPEKDSTASPQGNSVTDGEKYLKVDTDQSPEQHYKRPHADFFPLSSDSKRSTENTSLQQALQLSRPDFISRSQGRLRELERKIQKRRELSDMVDPHLEAKLRSRRAPSTLATSVNGNLFRPGDRAITRNEVEPKSKQTPAEVQKRKEEEKKKVCLYDRQ
ncbi:(E2-independent) E3 ubiquitin-conjugating enzyme FATS [Pholidichthys leucotaenia]